ncbi:MAG TPA: DUF1800 family protein, partial [Phycisphaerae bacterium]|nr:DUF1800 family protein [Phycisphaerae bacterium]
MAENLLVPIWQTPGATWNFEMAAHLLRRAGFGGTLDEIQALIRMGATAAVLSVVNYKGVRDEMGGVEFGELTAPGMGRGLIPAAGAAARGPAARGGAAGRGVAPPAQTPQAVINTLPEDQKKAMQQIIQASQRAKEEEIRLWWLDRMVRTKRPLEEKMTLFWHGLLVSSAQTVKNSYLLYQQNQLYRQHATGNFRTLIREVSRNPAMLTYLNNNQTVKAHPNENYAR